MASKNCEIDPKELKEISKIMSDKVVSKVFDKSKFLNTKIDIIHNALENPEDSIQHSNLPNPVKRIPQEEFIGNIIEGMANQPPTIDYLSSLHLLNSDSELQDSMYRSSDDNKIYFELPEDGAKYDKKLCIAFSKKTIKDICDNEMKDYNQHLNIYNHNLDIYKHVYDYQSYLGGIINERLMFLDKITNKINTYKQNNFIDNRKNSYLSSNLDFYKNLHFYVFILYYAIFIVFLIFSNFIKDKLYENKYVMIYVAVILIIPFILRYILSKIYNLYIYYIERNYLKLDEITYKYLVEETYHQKKNDADQKDLNNFHAIRNS